MSQDKETQKRLITEIMEADAKDGLYDITTEQLKQNVEPIKFVQQKKVIGWYCINHADFYNTTAFATYNKPNLFKRFFMRTLLDFYWIKDENK